jgi:hypothetical protein
VQSIDFDDFLLTKQFCPSIIVILLWLLNSNLTSGYRYSNYSQMTSILKNLAARYPDQASLTEIGVSEQGIRENQ